MRLRVTRQALVDLGLSVDNAGRRAEDLAELHPILGAFVERRSQSAEGQESTLLPSTKAVVWNLHRGRWRALTWHDSDDDVVWLLGAGWHESGSIDDAYAMLKSRDANDELFPTIDDYLDLETDADPHAFVAALASEASGLVAASFDTKRSVESTLGDTVQLRLAVREVEGRFELWLGFAMPPLTDRALPGEWKMAAVAAFGPGVALEDVNFTPGAFPAMWGRARSAYEVVVLLCSPTLDRFA